MTNLDKKRAGDRGGSARLEISSSEATSPAPAAAAGARAASCLIALALCVSACRTDTATTSDARTIDALGCGNPPSRPGYSAAFDGQGNATMSVATYQAIDAYIEAASKWITCRQMNP
jgi:hypothetical protein